MSSGFKVLLKYAKLGGSRNAVPVDDRDLGQLSCATPFAVSGHQCVQKLFVGFRTPVFIFKEELSRVRQGKQYFLQLHLIANASRTLGVVLEKFEASVGE